MQSRARAGILWQPQVGARAPSPSANPSASPAAEISPSATASSGPQSAPTALSEFARTRIDTMLRNGHADPSWFSASFLAQVPATQVDAILAQFAASLGKFKSIEGTQGDYTAHFEKGTDEILVHLDADKKIDGLLFKPPKLQTSSLEGALRSLRPSSGTLSYVIIEGRSERAALDASAPLAVGSAFKLAVLSALRDEIARGTRKWSDVVPLETRLQSLPTGVIRAWPDGTPITIVTYAIQMISISDNTAADALIRLAGSAALAPYALRNTPFLTTRQSFILKSMSGASARAAYLAAHSAAEQSKILARVDAMPLPSIDDLVSQPILETEWHYSVRELCDLIDHVADLPLMSVNPGAADPVSFQNVAFKGGSDLGAENLTTQVTTKRGTRVCFSATVNDPKHAIDETAFTSAYSAVLSVLENH